MNKKSNKGGKMEISSKVALGAGVLAASAAAYLLLGPDGKKNRAKVKDWSYKMKEEVAREIKKAKHLSEPAYNQIIARVREKYEEAKNIDRKDLAQFATYLQKEWKKISKTKSSKKVK